MKLIQKIKQHFCRHIDSSDSRNYKVPFVGYEFQCPKCKAYIAYFENCGRSVVLSELQHNTVIEEGKKLWAMGWNEVNDHE